MIDFIYTIWEKYLKYRYIDPILSFARYCIGSGLIFFTSGGAWLFLVTIRVWNIPIEFSIGPDKPILLGSVLILFGLALGVWRIRQTTTKQSCVLIDHRGLPGMNIEDPQRSLPVKYKIGQIQRISLFNENDIDHGETISPDKSLKAILALRSHLRQNCEGREVGSQKLAYAGLAPIPLMAVAGYFVSCRQNCLIMDYDRMENGWHTLDAKDDNEQFFTEKKVDSTDSSEVAIILPHTVEISIKAVETSVGIIPQYWIKLENGARADSLKSEAKQKRLTLEIYNLLASLRNDFPNLTKVHLFLATQASSAFRIGQFITPSVHPPTVIWQFNAKTNSYDWGVCIEAGSDPYITNRKTK